MTIEPHASVFKIHTGKTHKRSRVHTSKPSSMKGINGSHRCRYGRAFYVDISLWEE